MPGQRPETRVQGDRWWTVAGPGPGTRPSPAVPPRATALLGAVALLALVAHLALTQPYGYFRDELYYLVAGRLHPDWGYVDYPPLIAWLTALVARTLGTSALALRVLPALAHAALVVTTGLDFGPFRPHSTRHRPEQTRAGTRIGGRRLLAQRGRNWCR